MFEFVVISLLHAFSFTSSTNSVVGTGNGGWGNDAVGPKPKTTVAASSTTTPTTPPTKPGTGNGGWGND